jgi:predicted O-methyltransferase YrrM
MPTSQFYQISDIVEFIVRTNPKSILDIGVGFGKYGALAREYLDQGERLYDWKRRIDGIEVFEEYITDIQRFYYDNIYIGNAVEVLPKLEETYDLIFSHRRSRAYPPTTRIATFEGVPSEG